MDASDEVELYAVIGEADDAGGRAVELATKAEPGAAAAWHFHARGRIRSVDDEPTRRVGLDRVSSAIPAIEPHRFYGKFAALQITLGKGWQWLESARSSKDAATARIVPPPSERETTRVAPVHPVVLDHGILTALLIAVDGGSSNRGPLLPFSVDRLRWWKAPNGSIGAAAVQRSRGEDASSFDFSMLDETNGSSIAEIEGFTARRASVEAVRGDEARTAEAIHRLEWRTVTTPRAATKGASGRTLVVAAGGDPLGTAIAAALVAAGASCDVVGFSQLREALPAERVLCVWGANRGDPRDGGDAIELANEGLATIQALASAPARVWWITQGAQAIDPRRPVNPAAAALWGLARTARLEHPELDCGLVDLPTEGDVAQLVVDEMRMGDDEREIGWRDGERVGARLARVTAPTAAKPVVFRTDGAYLVTGGLGALGLVTARWLATRGVPHLVLLGRRGPSTPGAVEAVAELRALGARVTVTNVDVVDREPLAALLASIRPEQPLRGVVHAAGVLDDGVLTAQTPERFARTMRAKVVGAWHLDELTRDADLDSFVLFSSVVGVIGWAGQGAYAAANAVLDALAARRRALGLPAQSLDWGPWSESGMAAALDAHQRSRWTERGIGMISNARGIALLEDALGRDESPLVLARLDLGAIAAAFGAAVPPLFRALVRPAAAARPPANALVQQIAALPPARREQAVGDVVNSELARVLSLTSDVIVGDLSLKDLGLDSLSAVELRNALGKRVGSTLPATLAFDYPTASALTKFLFEKVSAAIAALSEAPNAASAENEPRSEPGRTPTNGSETESRRKHSSAADEPIAIVGLGCRYPGGVRDPESFWRLLAGGIDAVAEVPPERWDKDAWFDPDPAVPGKMTTRWGGFLDDLERFDPAFFGISPREAPSIDPQQRLLLETAWEALERAGIVPDQLMGADVGVYMGVVWAEYQARLMSNALAIDPYSYLGTAHSAMIGRLSYWLGVKGPNMPVDTACSSSLVALHLACQGLRNRECSLALAGGANVILDPESSVYFSKTRALSPTGRCRSFSADADGYVRAEGAGVLVLERLSDAQRNGRRVLALVRGSAVNQDGRSNGLTAPNGPAQQAVIRQALERGRVTPSTVGYLECHATGTPLGDPIEVQAAAAVLGEGRAPDAPLILGSFKSNIGHSEAAGGVGGVIKTVLALQHRRIPRSLHFTGGNPNIPWTELPVRVATEELEWQNGSGPRRAGVSSFGFSGTNAHIVLEEAPSSPAPAESPKRSAELALVSAKTEAALVRSVVDLAAHLRSHPEHSLAELAYSLATAKTHHEHRLALVAGSVDELVLALDAVLRGETPARSTQGRTLAAPQKVAYVFSGRGGHWLGMGRELMDSEPTFRAALETCARAIATETGWSPIDELAAPPDKSRLHRIDVLAPVSFAVEVALAALWRSWGFEPSVVVGHGMGEIAAAHVDGSLALEAAAAAICRYRPVQVKSLDDEVVRFAETIDELLTQAHRLFVEIGPHPILLSPIEDRLRARGVAGRAVGSLRRDQGERAALLESIGALHVAGYAVDWSRLYPSGLRRVDVPSYPFERERHWIDAKRDVGRYDPHEHPRTTVASADDGPRATADADRLERLAELPPDRRAAVVEAFLRRTVRDVLRLRSDELVDLQTPLIALGMDSLMSMELRQRVERALRISVVLKEPWSVARTRDLVQLALEKIDKPEGTVQIDSFCARRVAEPRARVFAFHHAGGLPESFGAWTRLLALDVELRAFAYPRDASNDLDGERYLHAVTAEIARNVDVPYAVLGHSLGAFFAWRVSATLCDRDVRPPQVLVLSSCVPSSPHVVEQMLREVPPARVLARISGGKTSEEDVTQPVVDAFLADLRLANTLPSTIAAIPVPILAFVGDRDPMLRATHLESWRSITSATLSIETLTGDHFYLFDDGPGRYVLRTLARELLGAPRSVSTAPPP